MRYLNTRQATLIFAAILAIGILAFFANNNSYTVRDITSYLESLDIGGKSDTTGTKLKGTIVDNNSPEMIQKHVIENKVNELLKKKVAEELVYERSEMEKVKTKLREQEEKLTRDKKSLEDSIKRFEKASFIHMNNDKFEVKDHYTKFEYSFSTQEKDGKREIDGIHNDNIIFSLVDGFGKDRTYEDFLKTISSLDFVNTKTTIALTVKGEALFTSLVQYFATYFHDINKAENVDSLKDKFSRVVLLRVPFLTNDLNLASSNDPKTHIQRRKAVARVRNFLISIGLANEKNALFLNSDVVETPKDMTKTFIKSGKDIATLRVGPKNADAALHSVHDKSTWLGSRKEPNAELAASNPEYKFTPGLEEGGKDLFDISSDLEGNGLTNAIDSSIQVNSVGADILFVKAGVLRQTGGGFPAYPVVGTTSKEEGWDGVDNEGLCYTAKVIGGWTCWAFPNLRAYISG